MKTEEELFPLSGMSTTFQNACMQGDVDSKSTPLDRNRTPCSFLWHMLPVISLPEAVTDALVAAVVRKFLNHEDPIYKMEANVVNQAGSNPMQLATWMQQDEVRKPQPPQLILWALYPLPRAPCCLHHRRHFAKT